MGKLRFGVAFAVTGKEVEGGSPPFLRQAQDRL